MAEKSFPARAGARSRGRRRFAISDEPLRGFDGFGVLLGGCRYQGDNKPTLCIREVMEPDDSLLAPSAARTLPASFD